MPEPSRGRRISESALPRLPRVYLPRPDLWEQLERASQHPMTLVVAPAGAGKTLGIAGWLRHLEPFEEVTWVHADATWRPERLSRLLDQGGRTSLPTGRRLVVIDDAHVLPPATLRELDRRLREDPTDLRLLLVARWDLPLTRLVPELLGNLTVLRGDVFRLDDWEAEALIAAHTGLSDPAVVRPLVERTEGWCAAVVLAARAVGSAQDPAAAAELIGEASTPVTDRVANEVFVTLSARQRHLLLCLAADPIVSTRTAVHLSGDREAGDLLGELESIGLLVSRLPVGPDHAGSGEAETTYRIHPLLTELVRRTLVRGGEEVEAARDAVVRAVGLDRSLGDNHQALARLLAVEAPEACADLLAEDGLTLTVQGRADRVGDLARLHPEVVEGRPDTWLALCLNRWFADDIAGAMHWIDRILEGGGQQEREVELAALRLMRARLGLEPVYAAVGDAKRVIARAGQGQTGSALPFLLTELGITQNWLGELGEAEANLTTAVWQCRNRDFAVLEVAGLSHLAFNQFLMGREHACVELASRVFERLEELTRWAPRHAPVRARVALTLARLCEVPAAIDAGWLATLDPPDGLLGPTAPVHSADLTTRFWTHVLASRLALVGGAVAEAERALQEPVGYGPVPDHLETVRVIECAFLSRLAGDVRGVRQAASQLLTLGLRGEAAMAEGLAKDLTGDADGAAADMVRAAADTTFAQPPTRALALVCASQLLDALGRHDDSLEHLRTAAVETEVRRNAVPFLGWCQLGTPVRVLLKGLAEETPSPWVRELLAAAEGRPDYVTMMSTTTPSDRERVMGSEPAVRPALSPREREVLHQLARGSTYADIAAALFVSENTVKTHVSSLYAKLGVSRRSEALAVSRNSGLI